MEEAHGDDPQAGPSPTKDSTPSPSWAELLAKEKRPSPRLQSSSASGAFGTSAYTRGVHISPDGLCVLALGSDHTLRLSEIPLEAVEDNVSVSPCLTMKENESIYDVSWYPLMNSSSPDTCCFAVTAHGQPIHLYDAFDGSIRATYRCINQLGSEIDTDRQCFPICATIHLFLYRDGSRLYAGMKNDLRVFDTAIPGKFSEQRKTWTKKEGGQAGIISSIATNPVLDGVYALATFSRTVGVYLEGQASYSKNHLLCLLEGQTGGVTHVKFSYDGNFLLAGGRKDNEILVWDMRNPGSLYTVLPRVVTTNQRIYFDVHPSEHSMVVTGNTDGSVAFFDLKQAAPKEDGGKLQPVWDTREMHKDCVNGVSFHPYYPYLATSSGQRRIRNLPSCYVDSDSDSEIKTSLCEAECTWKIWDFSQAKAACVEDAIL